MWDLLMKYLCPRDFRRGEMEEKMKIYKIFKKFYQLTGIEEISIPGEVALTVIKANRQQLIKQS